MISKTNHDEARARLAQFAEWTGTTPPATMVDGKGEFNPDFLAYSAREGLSLDWVLLGDVRGLVMRGRVQMASPNVSGQGEASA